MSRRDDGLRSDAERAGQAVDWRWEAPATCLSETLTPGDDVPPADGRGGSRNCEERRESIAFDPALQMRADHSAFCGRVDDQARRKGLTPRTVDAERRVVWHYRERSGRSPARSVLGAFSPVSRACHWWRQAMHSSDRYDVPPCMTCSTRTRPTFPQRGHVVFPGTVPQILHRVRPHRQIERRAARSARRRG